MNASESDRIQAPTKFSRAAVFVLLLVIVAIALAVISGLMSRRGRQAALAQETAALAVPTVTVVSPAPGQAAARLLLPAEVKPWIDSPIYARASGYVKRWLVDIGTLVQAGDLLAEIETPELDQQVDQARHELAQAEAALALAKTTADRYAGLLKTASVSEQDAQEKQADFAAKTASAAADRANLRRLEDLQGFARVRAPFAGIITARNIDVGELVAAGNAKELFRLAQTDKVRVYVYVPQTDAFGLQPGQPAEMTISELPGRVFTGRVTTSAGVLSADSRTLLTQLEVDNSRHEILPGCFAQVRLAATERAIGLVLPANTLLFRAEGPQVGVVAAEGKVQIRGVKLGRDFGQTVEILAGVGPTDKVILNPGDSLHDGMAVRVAEAARPEAAKSGKRQ